MFDNHVTALEADVVFNAVTGKTSAEIEQLRLEYTRTIGQMDDRALRGALAQDKLARALSHNTVESNSVKRATLAYRREMADLEVQTHRTNSAVAQEERTLSKFARGALVGSGALGRFARTAVFASSSLLGGFGLTWAIRSTVKAAEEQQVALGRIEVALRDTGSSWHQYGGRIEEALRAQVRATGFTDNELADSLAGFIRRFGDVDQALHANAIAADVARAKNISLADAQTLVLRASFGNPRSLRILGIELTKTTAHYDQLIAANKHASKADKDAAKAADLHASELTALDAVQARYHGNAARYLKTSAGRQALFNAEVDQMKEIIGAGALPMISRYIDVGTRWLSQERNQQRVQRDTKVAIHDTTVVLGLLRDLLRPVVHGFELLGKASGGTEREIKLLSNVVLALYLRSLLVKKGLFGLAAAEAAVGGSAVVSRVGAYTGSVAALGAASGEEGAAGKVGLLNGRLRTLAGFAGAVITITVLEKLLTSSGDATHQGPKFHGGYITDRGNPLDHDGVIIRDANHVGRTGYLRKVKGQFVPYRPENGDEIYTINGDTGAEGFVKFHRGKDVTGTRGQHGALHTNRHDGSVRHPRHATPPKPRFTDVIPPALQLALERAELAGDNGAIRDALRAQQAFLQQELGLASNDQQRVDITAQMIGIKQQLDSLTKKGTSAAKTAAAARLRRQTGAFRARESGFRAAEDRAAARDVRTSRRTGVKTNAAEVRSDRREEVFLRAYMRDHSHALKLRQEANARLAALEKHLAAIEKNTSKSAFAKEAQAFLEELSGVVRQYAPNIQVDQHFPRPPDDPHAASTHTRSALRAALA